MQISIFGYADVGSQTGHPLSYLSEFLYNEGLLQCVYPRGVGSDWQVPTKKPIPLGKRVPQLLTAMDQYTVEVPNRAIAERIYDYFAASYAAADASDVHLHYIPGHINTLEAGQRQGTPVIVRGSTEHVERCDERIRTEADKWGASIERSRFHERRVQRRTHTLQRADHIIAISEFVKQSYTDLNINPDDVTVAPLGVNADDYPASDGRSDNLFCVIYVGSVNLLKGIPYLLQAWNRLGWEDAKLTLCGDVSNTIHHLIDTAPETVKTPGFVDPRDYLSDAEVFVFPSLSDGFGKAALEAMATGTPVVVTSNTGMVDIITDGEEGFIVPSGDADALAEKIAYLRNNPVERERMGQTALGTAAEFTWERHSKRVKDILSRTVTEDESKSKV